LRDSLAAERTLLAWIRTGLALMGFGFVVARFGLFLQQVQLIQQHATAAAPSYGESLWFGTALIALGVVMPISADQCAGLVQVSIVLRAWRLLNSKQVEVFWLHLCPGTAVFSAFSRRRAMRKIRTSAASGIRLRG
jgi:uncharacterized membrane protein YidH (DUF202 family)